MMIILCDYCRPLNRSCACNLPRAVTSRVCFISATSLTRDGLILIILINLTVFTCLFSHLHHMHAIAQKITPALFMNVCAILIVLFVVLFACVRAHFYFLFDSSCEFN